MKITPHSVVFKMDSSTDWQVFGPLRQLTAAIWMRLPGVQRPAWYVFVECLNCKSVSRCRYALLIKPSKKLCPECLRLYRVSKARDVGKANFVHGGKANNETAPEYGCWRSMLKRCGYAGEDPRLGYEDVLVHPRWFDYLAFLADMGPKPTPSREYSIDRIDSKGHYEPANCRWVTLSENSRNTDHSDQPRDEAGCFTGITRRRF